MLAARRLTPLGLLVAVLGCRAVAPQPPAPAPTPLPELAQSVASIRAAQAEGRLDLARTRLDETVAGLAGFAPVAGLGRLERLRELERLAWDLGDVPDALRLCEHALDVATALVPAEPLEVLRAKHELAWNALALGDPARARAQQEEALAGRSELLGPEHPDTLATRSNLAKTLHTLGEVELALAMQEEVVAVRRRTLPPEDARALSGEQNLAVMLKKRGDLDRARAIEERILAVRARTRPPEDRDLLVAKLNLADTLSRSGDLGPARELQEEVLAVRERLLPPDNADLLVTKVNLAATLARIGDRPRARALLEEVVAIWSGVRPPEDPHLLTVQENLGILLSLEGEHAQAKEAFQHVVDVASRIRPPEDPELLSWKQNLGVALWRLNEFESAREIEEEVLAAQLRRVGDDHPDVLAIRQDLALTLDALGERERSRELHEQVLRALEERLPPDHPERIAAQVNAADARASSGELEAARELLRASLAGARSRALALRAESPRACREGIAALLEAVALAIHAGRDADPGGMLSAELLATVETLRESSMASARFALELGGRPDLQELRLRLARVRRELHDAAFAGPARDVLDRSEERDRLERELRAALGREALPSEPVDLAAVARALPERSAAVSFLRVPRWTREEATDGAWRKTDGLLAFVLRPEGSVARVDLGPAEEVEELAAGWRSRLGVSASARGVAADDPGGDAQDAGRRLRERVLDPVLAASGHPRALHVVPDDFLHLVPLEALPLDDGVVGDAIAVSVEISFAQLAAPAPPPDSTGLLVAGGLDYGSGSEFAPLPATAVEAESIASGYREAFGAEPAVLTGESATKAALAAAVPGARFVHLATHGWFAGEALRSQLDGVAESGPRRGALRQADRVLTGFAPEVLCGIALSGACVQTAEEIASLDLRGCALAVLSACESNVGIRRAGQGIQSLRAALHAAGARATITSLWAVDDEATQRLFASFYEGLWKEQLAPSEALGRAKLALRAEGRPERDWAAWVLTGR